MSRIARRVAAAIGAAWALLGPASASADIWYVDDGAPPGGSGNTWATAFRFLQDALYHPVLGPGDEIRVAAGTYHPDRFEGDPTGGGDPELAFALIPGVRIYGGFPPGGVGARDIAAHQTILSGAISEPPDLQFAVCAPPQAGAGDCFTATPGIGGCIDPECCTLVCNALRLCCVNEWLPGCAAAAAEICTSHRSVHVVAIGDIYCHYGNCGDVRLDGFTISGGAALIEDDDTDPYSDHDRDVGGGILIRGGDPILVNCTIEANSARSGGGGAAAYGGPHFVNCRFTANRAADGGAVYVQDGQATFVNCVFQSNTALPGSGGAAYVGPQGDAEMANCLFLDNLAIGHGSACYEVPVIRNAIVWGNGSSSLFGGDVTYSLVEQGHPGEGNIAGPPMFLSPITGDFSLSYLSPCIDGGMGAALPVDAADLDSDLDLLEPTPLDLGARPRLVNGTVDMGPYEYCAFDLTGDAVVDVQDLLALLGAWGAAAAGPPDFDGDGLVRVTDLLALLGEFGPCS